MSLNIHSTIFSEEAFKKLSLKIYNKLMLIVKINIAYKISPPSAVRSYLKEASMLAVELLHGLYRPGNGMMCREVLVINGTKPLLLGPTFLPANPAVPNSLERS